MIEEDGQGCERFITGVLAASTRERHGKTLTQTDWCAHGGDVVKIELTELPGNGWRLLAWTVSGSAFQQAQVTNLLSDSLEFGARAVWENLEAQRARTLNRSSTCDGGKLPCERDAVWAFKISSEGGCLYARGRHLTFSLTESSDGEQAEFTVRRITTEEH